MHHTNHRTTAVKTSVSFLLPICFFILLPLLILSLLLGCKIGKKDALRDHASAQDGTGATSTAAPSEDSSSNFDTSSLLLEKDGVCYLSAAAISDNVSLLDKNVYQVTLADGTELVFSENQTDFFSNNALGVLTHSAIVRENTLFIPLKASAAPTNKELALDAFAQCTATAANAPVLPNGTTPLQYFTQISETPTFLCDLSAYESYMSPAARDDYLILANGTHSIGESYKPENLTFVERARYAEPYRAALNQTAAKALDAFLKEAYAMGYDDITVTSGYRSYADQNSRFNAKVNEVKANHPSYTLEQAQNEAARYIQWPGKSEHQTGLACDMHNLGAASTAFGGTPEANWLADNAHKFGFILRYPADKTEITGISYEPWHFRFVGRYHATRMFLLDLTFEEYTVFLENTEVRA